MFIFYYDFFSILGILYWVIVKKCIVKENLVGFVVWICGFCICVKWEFGIIF